MIQDRFDVDRINVENYRRTVLWLARRTTDVREWEPWLQIMRGIFWFGIDERHRPAWRSMTKKSA